MGAKGLGLLLLISGGVTIRLIFFFDTFVPGINALSWLSITYIVEPFVFGAAFVGASSEIGIDWASFFLGVRFLEETLRS